MTPPSADLGADHLLELLAADVGRRLSGQTAAQIRTRFNLPNAPNAPRGEEKGMTPEESTASEQEPPFYSILFY